MTKTKKTPEQILKANLDKTLSRMKIKVADREGLWIEFFQDAMSALIPIYYEDIKGGKSNTDVVVAVIARSIADSALDEYEDRWGKG